MLSGKYYDLYSELKKVIPSERIFIDELRTLAYGTDASFYRLRAAGTS
jgi:D-lactate dehydrogenase